MKVKFKEKDRKKEAEREEDIIRALPTFITNDVIKMPDVPRYIAEYRKHLTEIFG